MHQWRINFFCDAVFRSVLGWLDLAQPRLRAVHRRAHGAVLRDQAFAFDLPNATVFTVLAAQADHAHGFADVGALGAQGAFDDFGVVACLDGFHENDALAIGKCQAFLTNSDLSPMAPIPSILQSMS